MGNVEVVRLLLDEGADVNAQGGEYGNALQVALLRGHQEIVQLPNLRGTNTTSKEKKTIRFGEHKETGEAA
ncbi:hypothetical protein FOTG_18391 [Fusarium oxysporum f. sp. vasinfectum 25433]|uniref:Uncharacterized protein n=1 Tax=Fusarium oxysporum f. sp. vasinfectum 25433 TaxID=1089449 RepID=X0KWI2_FUSOX|nr:hypothetical protein FOTG_18391 [Fusarium oxysporum f. sp. vasinfectum 25433]